MSKYEDFLPLSKSIAARELILAAGLGPQVFRKFCEAIKKNHFGRKTSLAKDTIELIDTINRFFSGAREFEVGEGGTTLRFFSLFLSRKQGTYQLRLGESLAKRSHADLWHLLSQLCCTSRVDGNQIHLICEGWPQNDFVIQSSMAQSSQHISGLLLASVAHPFVVDLQLESREQWVSEHYLDLTLYCCERDLEAFKSELRWKAFDGPKHFESPESCVAKIESDLSSAFSLASLEFLNKRRFQAPKKWRASLQPDRKFLDIFNELEQKLLCQDFDYETDLRHTPDLAPVLAILLAALGFNATLHSLHHLRNKESPRDQKISELLDLMDTPHRWNNGRLEIEAAESTQLVSLQVEAPLAVFDPEQDHRMAMAAALAQEAGLPIKILNKDCVAKSFPLFWTAWDQLKDELEC